MPASPSGDVSQRSWLYLHVRRCVYSAFIADSLSQKPQNQVENTEMKRYTDNGRSGGFSVSVGRKLELFPTFAVKMLSHLRGRCGP